MDHIQHDESFPRPGEGGFESFPKHAAEDAIEYSIFVPRVQEASERLGGLRNIHRSLQSLQRSLLEKYVWHKQGFALGISEAGPQLHLAGKTEFGDAIADEWAIVYLLVEFSKMHEDAWIRVEDSDGEFLLVEAANVLPKWLEPEVASHRVWINRGRLLVVPPCLKQPADQRAQVELISLDQALDFITARENALIHSPFVEAESLYRLSHYPKQIQESMHRGKLCIPRRLAYVLNKAPETISAAVETFLMRSPTALNRPNSVANGRFPPKDLVSMSIVFNRVGYAQLKSQTVALPSAWQACLNGSDDDNTSHLQTGMKVTVAFELLVTSPVHTYSKARTTVDMLLDDIDNGDELLPSDEDIANWPQKEDDESWLDVNFEDFEKDLAGNNRESSDRTFRDESTQDNLTRIVQNFEAFMNDKDASVGGVDSEDHSDSEASSNNPEEDTAASFNEVDFDEGMKQMMGIRAPDDATPSRLEQSLVQEVESGEDEPSVEEIQQMLQDMEVELKEEGALDTDDPDALKHALASDEESGIDPRCVLARNFLQSLKSQAGTSGATSNLVRSVGITVPRDDNDD